MYDRNIPLQESPEMERPTKPEQRHRIQTSAPFPVLLRTTDAYGEIFETTTVLDTLSAMDFSVRLARPITPGTKLFALIRCATTAAPDVSVPRVAVRGAVVRVEPQPDGQWGVGVQFTRYRFL